MPLKSDENGNIVVQDGKPVLVKDDGSETAVDVDSLFRELSSTRSEAKGKKEKIREYEKQLNAYKESFDGIDPDQAKKALELMGSLDQKKLIEAGEVDSAIKQAIESEKSKIKPKLDGYEKKLQEYESELSQRDQTLQNVLINGELISSQYLNKNTRTTPDVRQAILGRNFKVERLENGEFKAIAYDDEGNKIYSPNEPGRLATTEEAIQLLWNRYPHKDVYSVTGNSGSGSSGNPGGSQGKSQYTRSEWSQIMSKATKEEKAQYAKAVINGEITVK